MSNNQLAKNKEIALEVSTSIMNGKWDSLSEKLKTTKLSPNGKLQTQWA